MGKSAVIYWTGTGNTQTMAESVYEGLKDKSDHAELFSVDTFNPTTVGDYDRLALGCPAMGDEVLEESEFEPFFEEIESQLNGKKIALFGSYGWGDGQWMRDWETRIANAGAELFETGLIVNMTPDNASVADCRDFGIRFSTF